MKPKIRRVLTVPVALFISVIRRGLCWIGKERGRRTIFDLAGLCCVGGAIFLEILVFGVIESKGYFIGIERDVFILGVELTSAFVAALYFGYLFVRIIRRTAESVEIAHYENPTKRRQANREKKEE